MLSTLLILCATVVKILFGDTLCAMSVVMCCNDVCFLVSSCSLLRLVFSEFVIELKECCSVLTLFMLLVGMCVVSLLLVSCLVIVAMWRIGSMIVCVV